MQPRWRWLIGVTDGRTNRQTPVDDGNAALCTHVSWGKNNNVHKFVLEFSLC